MAVQAVVLSHHRRRQAPLRESMGSTVEGYNSLLERTPVIVLNLGIGNVDVSDELAAKTLKLKVRLNGITHLKSKSAKTVQIGDHQFQIDFDIRDQTIYEGADVFEFELCQVQTFGSSQTLATCQLRADEIVQTADVGRKTWSLDFLSVSTPGKVVARSFVQISCKKTLLRSAGGAKALKSISVPPPPVHTKSGSVFSFKEDAEDARDYVRKAGCAKERLEAVLQHVEHITSKRLASDLRLQLDEDNEKVEL